MKNVKIFGMIVATFFTTFLLLSIPSVSAVHYTTIKDSVKQIPITERVEIVKKILKLKDKSSEGTNGILNHLAYLVALFLFTLFVFISTNIWGIRPF